MKHWIKLLCLFLISMITSVAQAQDVAKIGTQGYASLEAAFAAANDGETIEVLADCAGNGIKVAQGKYTNGLTVNFNNHTYTMDGSMVGSSGTETQAFQLLKDNKITFKNGTIYSTKALMLVQNYSDLTLEGMTLTLNNSSYSSAYTLSNNNGNVVIDGSTINANPAGAYAFDVCRYKSYPSVHVTVTGNSVINGNVEVSASNSDAKDGFSLSLESGTLSGNLVIDPSADKAMEATPNKVTITKAAAFSQDAPEGYEWNSNGQLTPHEYVAQIGTEKYRTLNLAFAAAQDGQTITVLASSAGNGIKVPQGKYTTGLTVDFAGYTYTVDGSLVGSTGTQTQAFQLLKDNTITFKNGTIYSENAKMLVQNYSNLTLENMTLTLNNSSYNGAYTLSNNNGNVVINNSTITANPTTGSFAFDVCRYKSYPSVHVTVTGNSVINGDVEISASGNDAKDGFSLSLESGTLSGNLVIDPSADKAMEDTPDKAKVTKNNSFEQAAPDGYKWVDNGNGTSSLEPCDYVAQIGTAKYETLEAAFAAAQDGETITLLKDCAGNGIIAPQGKFNTTGLTVDFANHTYTVDGATVGSTGTETNGFQLLKDNKITFQNGTISSEKAKILVQNYSDLTLDNMTLTLNNSSYTSAYTLSNNNGNVVINNSTITANPAGGFAFDVCRYSTYPSVHVTVTGNSTINGNVEVSASGNDAKDGFSLKLMGGELTGDIVLTASAQAAMASSPENTEVTKADSFTQAAPAGYKWVDNGNETSSLEPCDYVAQIGNTKYETLDAAFAAATDGQTITLLKDCAGNGIIAPQGKFNTTGLTVDFANHTYTVDGATVGSTGTETNGFQLLKDNKITFQNGTISSEKAKILVQNYSNLTLEGMTLTLENPSYSSAYTLSNNNGNVVIDGSTITANPAGGFAFDVCRYSSYPSVSVTVTGTSVINGDVEVSASGSDAKDGFSLTLESGTLNGDIVLDATAQAAMAATPDKAEVTKANTFDQAAPTGYEWVDNGDGTSTLSVIYQAQIDETKYITFADAIAAVRDGETIELINDILPENQEITLPLTSGTITINGKYDFVNGTSERKAFKYGKKTILRMKKGVQVKDMPDDPGFNYNLNSNERNNAQKLTILPEDFTNCKIVSSGMNSTGHTYTVEDREFLFAVGEQQYETWATALSAVSDGGTITMLKDHSTKTLSIDYSTGKAITLDMNGFSLKELTFWTGDVTVVNGTILEDCDLYPQEENSGKVSNLTIGANCTANNGIVLWPAFRAEVGYDANLTVLGTVNNGIFVHGTLHEGNSVINIEDGGKVLDDDGVAIAMNGHATVNVKDGATVTGGLTGIEVRAGNLNVSGGAITGGSGETSVDPNASGSSTKNAGIAISQHTTKLPISVNVSYGEITATTALYIVNPQGNDDTAGAINVVISGDEEYPNFVGQTVIQDDRANLSISGGFFDTPVRAQDCAELYIPMIATGTRAGKYTVGIPYVAQITHDGVLTKYLSLAAACEAALEGDVVVMIDNSEETATSVVNKAITIDLNGKTVSKGNTWLLNVTENLLITDNSANGGGTLNGSSLRSALINNGATVTVSNATVTATQIAFFVNNGNLIINDATVSSGAATVILNSGDVTLNSGNLVGGSDVGIVIQYAGNFTMNGGKITGNGSGIRQQAAVNNGKIIINGGEIETKGLAIWPAGHGCELTINDGTITSTNTFAITMNGSADYNGGTTVNIKGGTMNGGIYSPNQDAVLNITGGTITGGTGITMKGGTLNISDGTVTGTGDYKEPAAASSGATETGAAIYVEDTYSAQGEGDFKPTVNITGGTFVSEHSYAVLFFTDKTTENYPYGGINIDYGVFVSPMADQTIKQVLPAGLDLKAIKIANGWYTEAIPAEYCVDGVEPDPNPRADAPDTRAQYTVLSTNEIILIDGEAYPYPGGIRAPKVTYRRTFSNSQVDKYQAWIVPMDYTLSDGDTQDFDFYKIHMIAASGDETGGLIDDNQPIYIYIEKLAAGRKISANLPYIVKPKSAGEFDFVVDNATLKADDHSRRLFMSTSEWNYEFYANYAEEMGATAANQWYAMSGGQICPNKNANAVLGSYRWYIKVTDNEFNDVDYAPFAFIFEEGEATGISHNYIFDENELEGIYTVNGIKQETVTKGVNILKFKNGTTKKVYVK